MSKSDVEITPVQFRAALFEEVRSDIAKAAADDVGVV